MAKKSIKSYEVICPHCSREFNLDQRENKQILSFLLSNIVNELYDQDENYTPSRAEYNTIRKFINMIGYPATYEAAQTAYWKIETVEDRLRYFCGICWRKYDEQMEDDSDE